MILKEILKSFALPTPCWWILSSLIVARVVTSPAVVAHNVAMLGMSCATIMNGKET